MRVALAPEENTNEKSNGTRDATVSLPMITPNCRERLTASDFEFIAGTLGAGRNNTATLAELLTDAEMRDSILDSEALFQAVLQGDAQLRISPQCYFYILLRHVLKERGISNRETSDYLASLLEKFSVTERMRAPGGAGCGPQQYVSDLLLALQKASASQAFLLRFAESGALAAHQKNMVVAGREKIRAVSEAARKHLEGCTYTIPDGGMNLWVDLGDGLDAAALRGLAQRAGVDYMPGRQFSVARALDTGLRLSFVGLEVSEIRRGLEILGNVVREARTSRAGALAPAGWV